jgi:uncharacterized membrane protein HdeD (DUF308 family)
MIEQPREVRAESELEFIQVSPQQRLREHWGLVLTYGVLTFLVGLALALWPSETVTVVAVLWAVQLVITGSLRLFVALVPSDLPGAVRILTGLAGAVAIVVAVLFFVHPLQTVGFIVVVAGSLLILLGFADLAEALVSTRSEHRVRDVVGGVLSVVAGGFLVISPERSLNLLVVITCAWLLCYGFMTVVAAFVLRSAGNRAEAMSHAT